MVTVVYVWKFNPDSAAEKFELVKTYTAENCQSFSAGGVEPVRPITKYQVCLYCKSNDQTQYRISLGCR